MKRIIPFSVLLLSLLALKPSDDFLILSIQKFNDYVKANPIVRVQLVLNQPKYSPGDTIFFKSFFIDSEYKSIKGKQILEAELRNEKNDLINQISYRVVDGVAENQIVIPDKITTGKLTLVSYSRWMKNFDTKYFYTKEIPVVSKFRFEEKKSLESPTILFFPEGGSLVASVANRILIKSNMSGLIKIKDNVGGVVSSGELDRHGIAVLKFTPAPNETYHAEIGTKSIVIGIAKDDGIAVQLQANEDNSESINLKLTIPKMSIYKNQNVYVIGTAKNRVYFSKIVQLNSEDSTRLLVPQRVISDGLNQLFILNGQGTIIAERIFWHNPKEAVISVQVDKETITPRSRCVMNITLADENGNGLVGQGVVSITNGNLFDERFSLIDNDIYLSEIPELSQQVLGKSIEAEYWRTRANDVLIEYKWNRIPWKDIFGEKWKKPINKFKYSVDIKGKAYLKASGDPLPDSTKLTIFLQNHLIGYDLYTVKDGFFELNSMYDFWGVDRLFCIAEREGKEIMEQVVLSFDNGMNSLVSSESTRLSDEVDSYGDFKLKKEMIDKSFNFYSEVKPKDEPVNSSQHIESKLGGSDWQIKADDYLSFSTMEEFIHELLSFTKFRKKNESGSIRVVLVDGNQNSYANGDPLFVIDGEMTKEISHFLSFEPKDILTIKIVRDRTKLSKLGTIAKNGVIIVQTKGEKKPIIANGEYLLLRGLNREPPPIQKNYFNSSNNLRIPDFRTTIYWNPRLIFDLSGKLDTQFFSSDDTGYFNIAVSGITNEGKPFFARKKIEVR